MNGNPFGAGARQRAIEDGAGVRRGTLDPNMQRLRNSYEPEGDVVTEAMLGVQDMDRIMCRDLFAETNVKLKNLERKS